MKQVHLKVSRVELIPIKMKMMMQLVQKTRENQGYLIEYHFGEKKNQIYLRLKSRHV